MIVKNKKGTGDLTCSGGCHTWKKHWINNSSSSLDWPFGCCNNNCDVSSNIVGAHVYKPGHSSTVYIIPFCKGCNAIEDEEFDVPAVYLLTASKTDDCK